MKYKKSDKTRDSVFNAAISLMRKKDIRGPTNRDICKRANVSHRHFFTAISFQARGFKEIYLPGDAFFRIYVSQADRRKIYFSIS
jgi:hypothetical protein